MIHLTAEGLQARGAYTEVQQFATAFPEGCDLTPENVRRIADAGLCIQNFARHCLTFEAYTRWENAVRPSWEAYDAARIRTSHAEAWPAHNAVTTEAFIAELVRTETQDT